MRLQDAIAALKQQPETHAMWRPGDALAFVYQPVPDGAEISFWYLKSQLKEMREELRRDEDDGFDAPLASGAGGGYPLFSFRDMEAEDWVVLPLEEARAVGYTRDVHDPLTCADCVRESARERGQEGTN